MPQTETQDAPQQEGHKVELKQYTCWEKRRGKPVKATRPQQRIYLDGQFVGYVSDKPGTRFCPTWGRAEFTSEELAAIDAAIKEHHGGVEPPPAARMPQMPDEDEDEAVDESADDLVFTDEDLAGEDLTDEPGV